MLSWLHLQKPRYDVSEFPADAELETLRFTVLDTEMTSLEARTNRMLSVGAIGMNGGRIYVGQQFYLVANPGVAVPEKGVLIHKLRPEDIEHGEQPAVVLKALAEVCKGSVLVGHFMRVDYDLLTKEFAAQGMKLGLPAVCTARVQQWIVRHRAQGEMVAHESEKLDLAALAREYQLDFQTPHHALDDAFLTARLWQKMLARLNAMGVRKLAQLLQIAEVK